MRPSRNSAYLTYPAHLTYLAYFTETVHDTAAFSGG
jgi:hypothetical protein